ncbi:hypothetical protein J2129_002753 [Methanofollis sp. W23]|uniref:hypothetical protein n=1 Tax=Methanofollis sp. W23 TaxID=2817849 RepID=UPI001AE4DC76|nr:hypothetical protein [Methanofollis sp. W23]MBP2147240.1 hypothetical protein [Methanofollis sp. W23]
MIAPRALCGRFFSVLFGTLTAAVALYGVSVVDSLAQTMMGLPSLGIFGLLWAALVGGITIAACRGFISSSPDVENCAVRHTDPLYAEGEGE